MSRIGSKPIILPESVKVEIKDGKLFIAGPKGNLVVALPEKITAQLEGTHLSRRG